MHTIRALGRVQTKRDFTKVCAEARDAAVKMDGTPHAGPVQCARRAVTFTVEMREGRISATCLASARAAASMNAMFACSQMLRRVRLPGDWNPASGKHRQGDPSDEAAIGV